jgi:hypothetical protein
VPELRLVTFVVMTLMSCLEPSHIKEFAYNVQHHCGPNGSFYREVCNSDLAATITNPYSDGAYDPEFLTDRANRFAHLAKQWGGVSTDAGQRARELADSWLKRGARAAAESPKEAAEEFFKRACLYASFGVRRTVDDHNLDVKYAWYIGSDYWKYGHDPLTYETAAFLYDSCKDASFDACYSPFLKDAVGTGCALTTYHLSLVTSGFGIVRTVPSAGTVRTPQLEVGDDRPNGAERRYRSDDPKAAVM